MNKPGCYASSQHGVEPFPLLHLPEDMQRAVLSFVPLRQLAQLACFSKELRIVYLDRVRERDAEVAVRLESNFPAEFREGLSSAQTVLPRDLMAHPQMDPLLQAAPEECCSVARRLEAGGGQYQGFCLAGKLEGRGKWTDRGGNTYLGEFHKGQPQGWGSMTYVEGDTYVGQWSAGQRHGQGTYTWQSGESYEGEWDMGTQHGYGTWASGAGDVYVGEWVAGMRHGQGCQSFLNGARYEGGFKNQARDGLGYFIYPDGSKFLAVSRKGALGALVDIS